MDTAEALRSGYFYSAVTVVPMDTLAKRITQLRKQKGLSQKEMADRVEVSLPQLSRYETQDVQPPADVLGRIALVLGTSTDYLIYGERDKRIKSVLRDVELLQLFADVERLADGDKKVVKVLIDAFLTKRKLQKLSK